jgi:hypothetical protein
MSGIVVLTSSVRVEGVITDSDAGDTGRRARALEIDPSYVDVAVSRWQKFTGKTAVHAETGQTFEDVADARKENGSGQAA